MYDDITYKFKEILNRIIMCINNYIDKNIKNPNLVESKLLSINNYIIDILHKDSNNNSFDFNCQNNLQSNTFSEKMANQLINSHEYDEKNMTLSRLKHRYFPNIKEQNENKIHSYIDFNYNAKERQVPSTKSKIIKLKHNLKDEQDKKTAKDFSLLKRLSYLQKKVNLYALKKKQKINDRNGYGLNNNSYNKSKNNFIINFYPNNCKDIGNPLSQCKLKKKNFNKEFSNNEHMNTKYDLFKKTNFINKFFKYDLGEIKKTHYKKCDRIKYLCKNLPLKSHRRNISNK
jgi:hypothetical protein